jgi:hypothetical protein
LRIAEKLLEFSYKAEAMQFGPISGLDNLIVTALLVGCVAGLVVGVVKYGWDWIA